MNTETILAVVISVVILIATALVAYAINSYREINERISELDKTADWLSKRISTLDCQIQKQPPTAQPEVKDEPRTFVNVYGTWENDRFFITNRVFNNYDVAHNLGREIVAYLETVEIIRHKKA